VFPYNWQFPRYSACSTISHSQKCAPAFPMFPTLPSCAHAQLNSPAPCHCQGLLKAFSNFSACAHSQLPTTLLADRLPAAKASSLDVKAFMEHFIQGAQQWGSWAHPGCLQPPFLPPASSALRLSTCLHPLTCAMHQRPLVLACAPCCAHTSFHPAPPHRCPCLSLSCKPAGCAAHTLPYPQPLVIAAPASLPTADLLAVQHTPEWPAATLLLRRLALALNTPKGLQVS